MSEEVSLNDLMNELNRRFDKIDERFDGISNEFKGINDELKEVKKQLRKQDRKLNELGDGFTMFKGAIALLETLLETGNILHELGLHGNRFLSKGEIEKIVNQISTKTGSEIVGDLQALLDVDVLMSAFSYEVETHHFIPVSVSWTVDRSDVDRSLSYARLLRELPDIQEVVPAVSGRYISEKIEEYCRHEGVFVNKLRQIY